MTQEKQPLFWSKCIFSKFETQNPAYVSNICLRFEIEARQRFNWPEQYNLSGTLGWAKFFLWPYFSCVTFLKYDKRTLFHNKVF